MGTGNASGSHDPSGRDTTDSPPPDPDGSAKGAVAGARDPAISAARIGAMATIATAIIAGLVTIVVANIGKSAPPATSTVRPSAASAAASPTTSLSGHSATASPSSGAPGTLRRQGVLVLEGNGTDYDIDSLANDWDPIINHYWVSQNIAFLPGGDNGRPLVQFAGSPGTDVVMSGKGPWSYQECASAPYYANTSTHGPNVIAGRALQPGTGICVITQDVAASRNGGPKTDGDHVALLVVSSLKGTTLRLKVTVWYGQRH